MVDLCLRGCCIGRPTVGSVSWWTSFELANAIPAMLAVAAAQVRTARRLARTWVFAVLAVGLNLAVFGFYAYLEASYSPDLTGRSSWRLLMGQFGTYLLTTVAAGAVFLGVDVRARDDRVGMTEVLDSRPLSNPVLIGGQVAGLALTAWLTVLVALGVVQASGAIAGGLWGVGRHGRTGLARGVCLDRYLADAGALVFGGGAVGRRHAQPLGCGNDRTGAARICGLVGAPVCRSTSSGRLSRLRISRTPDRHLVRRFADVEALLQRGSMFGGCPQAW